MRIDKFRELSGQKRGILEMLTIPEAAEIQIGIERAQDLPRAVDILSVDEAVALENAGDHVPAPRPLADSLIAATAKVHGLCMVTGNVKDFEAFTQTHGLRVLNP